MCGYIKHTDPQTDATECVFSLQCVTCGPPLRVLCCILWRAVISLNRTNSSQQLLLTELSLLPVTSTSRLLPHLLLIAPVLSVRPTICHHTMKLTCVQPARSSLSFASAFSASQLSRSSLSFCSDATCWLCCGKTFRQNGCQLSLPCWLTWFFSLVYTIL